MAWFQLDPQSIAHRARSSDAAPRVPTLAASVVRGVIGFAVVSVAGFAPWAFAGRWFYPRVGEVGLYATCAFVFIAGSGLALHRLIIGSGSLPRFYKVFSLAFAVYAALWIVCSLGFRGRSDLLGLFVGTAAMGAVLTRAFGAMRELLKVVAALFLLNAAGYYAGGWVMAHLIGRHNLPAMLLWGVCYGIGFGAGLGIAFHACQAEARRLLGNTRFGAVIPNLAGAPSSPRAWVIAKPEKLQRRVAAQTTRIAALGSDSALPP